MSGHHGGMSAPDSIRSSDSSHPTTRIALVGNRSPHVQAHQRIPALLETLGRQDDLDLDVYWIPTEQVDVPGGPEELAAFDGVWGIPGSPYHSEAGALAAIRTARTAGIPYLGTCGGFQHAVLEYARNVCGLAEARHGESDPDAPDPLIGPLTCSLAGHEAMVRISPGSLAERILGTDRTLERYRCAYGVVSEYVPTLTEHGLVFSGHDQDGEVRILELPGHPFFLGTLFQPELAEDGPRPHPVIRAFAAAAEAHARSRVPAA